MVSKSTPWTDGPVTLHFHDITRVAGETITGRVDLNVTQTMDDNLENLRIKFKGIIHGKIVRQSGPDGHMANTRTITLFDTKITLWDQETAFPAPASHTLSLPFEFLLPQKLPPSFHCSDRSDRATISYALEVMGQRNGFLRTNRCIRRLISVVPAASRSQLLAQESLRQGWNGPWRDFTQEAKLRQGIWGDYSSARLKVTIPDMASYPIATAIPFGFHVETETKAMGRSDAPVDKNGKPLFPAPPASSEVRLGIHRWTRFHVGEWISYVGEDFDLKGGLEQVAAVHQVCDEPEWIPATGPKD